MKSEVKTCQNCKSEFLIEPEDFEFYESMKVPTPTFCPRCRLQRRLAFYNLFSLYKRKCDLCQKDFISIYPPDSQYTVYCHSCWWSDKWDPLSYGIDYDFSKPFLKQFNELLHRVPLLGLANSPDMAQAYANQAARSKNCYLIFEADENEDCYYGFYLAFAKSTLDSSLIYSSERTYDCSNSFKVNNCIGLRDKVTESVDCHFLRYSSNCQNCFASQNLRSKQYVAFNKQYTKEEYTELLGQYDLGSYKTYKEVLKKAWEHWKKLPPDPDVSAEYSVNYTGSYVFQSKNCKECYETVGAEDCKYIMLAIGGPIRDCYDVTEWGLNLSRSYECMSVGTNASELRFCSVNGYGSCRVEYSREVFGGSDLLGCIALRKKQYCIFNKQYSKESFEALKKKIVKHMNDTPYTDKSSNVYKYGEFFPIEVSPHAYNETIAANFFPMDREEVHKRGYRWRNIDAFEYKTTLNAANLPDHIKDTHDNILNEVVKCERCSRGFRVIREELEMRRRMNVPLSRLCPFCRIHEKFNEWVKKMMLSDRTCNACGTLFRTHHTKEDAPYILCRPCYLKEVV